MIVKTWPDVPTNAALQQSSGLPKSRVMLYRSSMSRRSDVDLEARVPADHPLRRNRVFVALSRLK